MMAGMDGAPPAAIGPARARPIGVFDSGVGGLTVLHELLVRLPHEDFLYLGDTARFPYGERSPEELERFAAEIAEELLRRRAKLLVVACNSAPPRRCRACARGCTQTTLGVDVLGVVRPEAMRAVAATRTGRIGLLATPDDGRQRRLSSRPWRGRPARDAARRAVPDARADHPGRRAVRRAGGGERARGVRAAARGRGRHRDPRLHPLPADQPRCCSGCSGPR